MLRHGATQSGLAYPKFYVWVEVSEGGSVKAHGAVRLAAIDKVRFEVTDFVSATSIRSDPASIYDIFPASVCETIKARLDISE